MRNEALSFGIFLLALAGTLSPGGSAAQAEEKSPVYAEHQNPLYYLDAAGAKHPVKTVADWEVRKRHVLAGLLDVMGSWPDPDRRVPLDVKQVEEVRVGDLVRRKITFQSEPTTRVPAYLFLPPSKGKKLPAVLCLQQTTRNGKDEPAGLRGRPSMHVALHLAQRGYVTLAPDFPGFGEYAYDFSPRHGYQSGTAKAVWDNRRAVDLLAALSEVDAERIGCLGHSLGGHMTMFTGVFEPRLKVLVSSCGFCRFHRDDVPSWNGPVYFPRIKSVYRDDPNRLPFDFPEVVAALAPRPFLASAAVFDNDFDVRGVRESLRAAEPIYALYGKAANLRGYYPLSDHEFPEDARRVAYEFIDQHLKAK